MHRYSGLVRDFSFYVFVTMTTTTAKEFSTNSVKIVDNSIVINFTSEWVDKTKTIPLNEKGIDVKERIQQIFDMKEYWIPSIWKDIKEWGRLYWYIRDFEAEKKIVDDAFAALDWWTSGSSNPIDDL